MKSFSIEGNIVDVINRKIFPGSIKVVNDRIFSIEKTEGKSYPTYICPGFIDAHVHIESSMLVPSEFARLAVKHGTVATVSDPHEIANVLGTEGVNFMIENGKTVPFKFYFGAPSCVPATNFETSGAVINKEELEELLKKDEIKYLSEMMNFPGVINGFHDVLGKIEVARLIGKPVDGHAPGLTGEALRKYINAGINTDHECFSINEAKEKIAQGMKILIREGSAAKNFSELHPLIKSNPDMLMLCSDDKHPDDLLKGHINDLVKRALSMDYNIYDVFRDASLNAIEHYKLDVGCLKVGDPADFIIVDNLDDFNVLATYINGIQVMKKGAVLIESNDVVAINKFNASLKSTDDFKIKAKGKLIRVIEAIDGQLITNELHLEGKIEEGCYVSDVERDILKIAVINRYEDSKPSVGFIRNFGFKKGAIASSVAHDSHNIVAVGTSDELLCKAVNAVIESKGGLSVANGDNVFCLELPVGGLMSTGKSEEVAGEYLRMNEIAKSLGTKLKAPFMTLSFMALLVIPKLKLSDKGLFDGSKFEFTELYV
jgi:adenine deaminase